MYWFSDGPETINDLSWPEYARRLLVAYDLEREGRDSKDVIRGLRGELCSQASKKDDNEKVYLKQMHYTFSQEIAIYVFGEFF